MVDFNCDTSFGIASLGGIEFEILPSDYNGGRRIQTHEYPFRDDHYNEDLGDKPGKWSIKGAFVGDGWRDRFTEAKQKWRTGGMVEFFEPTENVTHETVIVDWSFDLDSTKLNYVEFTIGLVERGLEPYLSDGKSTGDIATNALERYLDGVQNWWLPRFNLYADIAKVFNAYDSVRGYLDQLKRQFMGLGSLLGVGQAVDAMQPTRDQATNYGRVADVFEAVASNAGTDSSAAINYHRVATEVRIVGTQEEQDQASIASLVALGYYFEAIAGSTTRAEVADFRTRADSIKADIDEGEVTLLVDSLLTSLGQSMQVPCQTIVSGQSHALVLAYQAYGRIDRASEIIAMSRGVSGSAMNDAVYECPA